MLNKYKRMVIWEMDQSILIENIPDLLALNYNKEISYLRDFNIGSHEKTLYNRWEKYYENFEVRQAHIMGQNISYIPTQAAIEVPAPEHNAIIDDMVLPKENRVKLYQQSVFFLDIGGRIYSIVIGAEHMDCRIRSALMGCGRNPEPSHTNWGQVNFSDIIQYRFDSDFFYWLISKRESNLKTCYGDMALSNIRRLDNSSERGDTNYSSEGENILNEAVPKTGLGVNTIVDKVGMTIATNEGKISIVLENNGVCKLERSNSSINLNGGEIDFADNHLDKVSIMIYSIIIPALRAAYNFDCNNGVWTNETHNVMCRRCALDAINELCYENNITLEELSQIECFRNYIL